MHYTMAFFTLITSIRQPSEAATLTARQATPPFMEPDDSLPSACTANTAAK